MLILVIVFFIGWESATKAINVSTAEIQSLYRAEAPFDLTLLENRWVSGDSLIALREHFDRTAGHTGFRPAIAGSYVGSDTGVYTVYRLELSHNINGVVDTILIVESR